MKVTPAGRYTSKYGVANSEGLYPVDNTTPFVIDLTEGAKTSYSTTWGDGASESFTFFGAPGSFCLMTASCTYQGRTDDNAVIFWNQIGDVADAKRTFSVSGHVQYPRMCFLVTEVQLPWGKLH